MKVGSLLLLTVILPVLAFAGVSGKLAGTVLDADSGEPLVGANVEIVGTLLGASTDADGSFIVLNVPPGNITLRISYLSYETLMVENVRIIVDQTTLLTLNMEPTTVAGREVVVVAERPLIQKDLTGSISVIRREEIEALPVTDFKDVLALQPGVVKEGNNLNVRGGRSNEVAYLIDGMYVQDPVLGGLATDINNDAIQEMSLLSGTFNAEYGNALSGVVNIVTRDGGEDYGARIEGRTSRFGVEKYDQLEYSRLNGFFSGPLLTRKLRFFLSGEHERQGNYLPFGYRRRSLFFGKLSYFVAPTVKLSLSGRGNIGRRQNYYHDWKYIPEQYSKIESESWQTIANLTHNISKDLFYDLRVSWFDQQYFSGIKKDTSEFISSNERQYFRDKGNGFEFYSLADPVEVTDSRTQTLDVKADAVWQAGNVNEVKLGGQYKYHQVDFFNIYDPTRKFPYIDDYRTNPFEAAAYIQDKIEFPFLIINLGLRYDYLNANAKFRTDPLRPETLVEVKPRSQFSPRLGIAHPITERTKLHFAYGHFFQNPEFRYLFENRQYDLNVREPLFGQPNLDARRTIAYEVGLAHQFSRYIALHLTAYYKDVTGLIGTRYNEAFLPGSTVFVGYTLYVNEDYANIKGFEINLDISPGAYFSGGLNYTFSIAKGSASSETEQYPGTTESTKLYYLNFDKRHILNATGNFTIPRGGGPDIFGAKLLGNSDYSLIFSAASGFPYTPGGRDVGFVERNSLRQPATYYIDFRLGKDIPLTNQASLRIFAEILNLTDHRNVLYVYRDTGEPDFTFEGAHSPEYMQDPSNFGPPREIRLGMGLRF